MQTNQLPTPEQIEEAPFWEKLRKSVIKLPTKVYFTISTIIDVAAFIILFPAMLGLDPTERWFKVAAFIVVVLSKLFTRPKAPIDVALDQAAQLRVLGQYERAQQIAEAVVEVKAARLQKKAA